MLEDISTDLLWCLNESPSEKEGKYSPAAFLARQDEPQ